MNLLDLTPDDRIAITDIAVEHICPNKVQYFTAAGYVPIMAHREGHYFHDIDGARLFDVHLNGGVYNLGHRNPEIIRALTEALESYDIGNHHFVSGPRSQLARELCQTTRTPMQYALFTPCGAEAVEVAIRSARKATNRRRILSVNGSYHGHSTLGLLAGGSTDARYFLSDDSAKYFTHVPFNDISSIESELAAGDVAAVIVETIPATSGFPMPKDGYLPAVKAACEKYGALYIADEVQTGLGRTGRMWAVEGYGVDPDILVTGKGLSGGIYPIAATLMSAKAGAWLQELGWGHSSTFGGSEVGCMVALKALEIIQRPSVLDNVRNVSEHIGNALEAIRCKYPILKEVRQNGLVMGLKFNHPRGGELMMGCARAAGIWGFVAGYDRSVFQYKPNLLIDISTANELLAMTETAVRNLQSITDNLTPDYRVLLEKFEENLNPDNPEQSGAKIVGYGEVSTVLAFPQASDVVFKRSAGFQDRNQAVRYAEIVRTYIESLQSSGVDVIRTELLVIERPQRPPVLYLIQPRVTDETLGQNFLKSSSNEQLIKVLQNIFDHVSNVTGKVNHGLWATLDAQISNWVITKDEKLQYLDVGQPFLRKNGQLAEEVAPLLRRPYFAPFRFYIWSTRLVERYIKDYFEFRKNVMDIFGNFIKEGHHSRLPVALFAFQQWNTANGSKVKPITKDDVEAYYASDAGTLELSLRMRRLARKISKVLGRKYDYILPGKIERNLRN